MQYIIQASLKWYISLGIIYYMDGNLMFFTKDLSCIYYTMYKTVVTFAQEQDELTTTISN